MVSFFERGRAGVGHIERGNILIATTRCARHVRDGRRHCKIGGELVAPSHPGRIGMKRSAVLLCLAIYAISAHAGSGKARLVAKVGSWMVLEHRHNQCRAFSENDGGQEMFALRPDGNGMWLKLIDDKLRMPAGDYPVGISMNEYSVTTTGHVSSESPRTIVAVTLSK